MDKYGFPNPQEYNEWKNNIMQTVYSKQTAKQLDDITLQRIVRESMAKKPQENPTKWRKQLGLA